MRNRVWELYIYTCCISLPARSRQPRSGAEFFQRAGYMSVFSLQQVSPRLNFYTSTSLKKTTLNTDKRLSAPGGFPNRAGFDGNRTVDVSARYVSLDISLLLQRKWCDSRVRLHEKKKKKKKKSCLFHLVLCKSDEMRVDPADPLKLKEQQKKQKNDRASFPDKQHRAEEWSTWERSRGGNSPCGNLTLRHYCACKFGGHWVAKRESSGTDVFLQHWISST